MKKRFLGMLVFFLSLTWLVPIYAGAESYPYYITVNLTQNIVTVYNMDEEGRYTLPEKAFYCSGGEETPVGTFHTSDKYVWRPLFGDVYGQYATRVTGHILFHSVPYLQQDKSTLEYEEYNKLGEIASMGCIRMTVEDVKWIYDNCPSGTSVKMYRSNEPEPLEPTKPQKIDLNDTRRNWDPTDPDPANPWKKGNEVIEMGMQSGAFIRKIDVDFRNGNYALTADDAQLVFGNLGVTLVLPQYTEGLEEEGNVEILFQRHKYKVSYVKNDGKVYFNLRDLAEIIGVNVRKEEALGEIDLEYNGTTGVSLLRLFPWKNDSNQSIKSAALATE
ncbi:L,D-transpeptidase [Anaerotignum sp. MB30-C6]|uniref:L,D-transpeptidase n=1 Tax=Anaerotignum sp. MB30-C6 TaxID=3070814 RepID=UPI0027DCA8AF|nr:L,D-transpeptidase [Anaerotignum sp. MB30-C6]WMI80549.1 L,D-transpeptidase [Anaerotignum sp. MB30-C6]